MKPIEIKENVYWVGALDWNVRDFHGYTTNKGTSYNAYLIVDEKIALVDTVKEPFKSDLIQKIGQVRGLTSGRLYHRQSCGAGSLQ